MKLILDRVETAADVLQCNKRLSLILIYRVCHMQHNVSTALRHSL